MRSKFKDWLWYVGFVIFCTYKRIKGIVLYSLRIPSFSKRYRKSTVLKVSEQPSTIPIPKKIWFYWDQGWENAPNFILKCRDSWIFKNPGWEIKCLDRKNVNSYISLDDMWEDKKVSYVVYSDIVRINLLEKYGGVWVDADVVCVTPLDYWLPQVMENDFFAFVNSSSERIIENWFLAASPASSLISRFRKLADKYWKRTYKAHHYFWFHYLFEYGYFLDPVIRKDWDEVQKIDNKKMITFRHLLKSTPLPAKEVIERVLAQSKGVPMHKINYRSDISYWIAEKLLSQ